MFLFFKKKYNFLKKIKYNLSHVSKKWITITKRISESLMN